MKNKSNLSVRALTFLSIPLLFGLIVSLSSCGSEEKTTEMAAMEHQEESQLWTCGMHPEVLLHEPGQCPICKMDLVPVRITSGESEIQDTQSKGERKVWYWQAPMDPTEIYDE